MKVSMMQPTFLPWMGYFELIMKADVFVFLDDFQYSVQSYHQRNRLFVNKDQVDWYTVPVIKSKSFEKPINEVVINEQNPWRKKFLKRIENNYSKAEYYSDVFPIIKEVLEEKHQNLAQLNMRIIKLIIKNLQIDTEIRLSSEFSSEKKRSERVLELLKLTAAKEYYSAQGSFEYMFEDKIFPVKEIDVYFQDFVPPEYKQIGSSENFIPYLSVIDVLMNNGFDNTKELISSGTREWLDWSQMKKRKGF